MKFEGGIMETLLQDLRYGLRMLAKNPGFMAVAVVTLAWRSRTYCAVFCDQWRLLSPLPFPEPEQSIPTQH